MSATSLEGARHLSDIAKTSPRHENYSKKGILVGGSERNEVQLSKQDVDLIKSKFTGSSTSSGEVLVPEIPLAYRSLLLPQQGIQGQGLLYRTGEHVFLNMNNVQSVVLVEKFLGLEIEGEYHKFIQGQLLPTKQDDNGKLVTFESTGFPILCHGSLSQKIIVPAPSILRKAIVFPNPSEPLESIVVDFMRKSMPLSPNDVVVPLYPKEGEMVFINGTDPQPWFGRVLSVDANHQIAKVLYYNKVGEREDVYGSVIAMYSPERNPRLASDKVSWNTLLHNADGDRNEDIWEMVPGDY